MGTSVRLTRFVTDDLSHLMVFSCCTRRFTPMTCIKVCIIMLHVTVTFNLIRGTNLAEFFSCAMIGDGQCVVVNPFLLLSWILLLFAFVTSLCIWSFTTVRTCLPTFPLNSQESAESRSIVCVSTCLHHSLNLPASFLFSHCPHVTASTRVLHLFAFRL